MMEVWLLLVFVVDGNEQHTPSMCCPAPHSLSTLYYYPWCGSCFSLWLQFFTPLCSLPCNSVVSFNCAFVYGGWELGAKFPTPEFGCDVIWPTERNRNVTVRFPGLDLKKSWETLCVSTFSHASAKSGKRSWSTWTGSCLVLDVG